MSLWVTSGTFRSVYISTWLRNHGGSNEQAGALKAKTKEERPPDLPPGALSTFAFKIFLNDSTGPLQEGNIIELRNEYKNDDGTYLWLDTYGKGESGEDGGLGVELSPTRGRDQAKSPKF